MIEAKNLTKRFGNVHAVNNVSLSIKKGDIVGFLGPNGAGKSTTMRLLTGFINADKGAASICGYDVAKQRQRAQSCLGYLPEAAGGFPNLTVVEFLKFCCGTRGIRGSARSAAITRIIEIVRLDNIIYDKMHSLSKGWRQRVWLAQSLIHDPSVLILDEPTDGLDPNEKDQVRKLIRSFSSEKAIVLSTHVLEEAEEICNRTIIIDCGKLVLDSMTDRLLDTKGRLFQVFRDATSLNEKNN